MLKGDIIFIELFWFCKNSLIIIVGFLFYIPMIFDNDVLLSLD